MSSRTPEGAAPKLRLVPSVTSDTGGAAAGAERGAERGPDSAARPRAASATAAPPALPALDDSELLAAMRAADPTAATAFHGRVRPQVDRTIARLLGRRDADHEDLAQLAMIELVYTIDRYRGDCSLDAWTSTLTARVVYKQIRRRQTERRLFSEIDPEDLVARSPTQTDRDAMARSVMQRVRGHLEGIDANKAWTFLLHDVCGYDLQEIAEITGVSVSAAQTRLVRGRREVHERIAADPELANRLEEMEGSS